MNITFDQLPQRVLEIDEKLDQLLALLTLPEQEEEPDRWFQIDPLCDYLGQPGEPLPKATVYGWVREGKIPHSKKGKRLYFSKRAIDAWLREAGR